MNRFFLAGAALALLLPAGMLHAHHSGIAFDRFYLNVDRVGNTSSASIPLALVEMENDLSPGDKLVLCSVGAGLTTAATTVEW